MFVLFVPIVDPSVMADNNGCVYQCVCDVDIAVTDVSGQCIVTMVPVYCDQGAPVTPVL